MLRFAFCVQKQILILNLYKMKRKITIILSIALVGFFFSCENQSPDLLTNDLESISIDEINSLKYGEIGDEDSQEPICGSRFANFRQRIQDHRFNRDCITVTTSGEEFPKEIIIDYGEGCVGRHGELRTGKIIINISDNILNEGATYEMKFENVMIGERAVEMTKTKTNSGQNEEGNWLIESSVEQSITYEDGSSSSRSSTNVNEWLSGFGTEAKADDIFLRTGSGNVITSEGAEYSREITTALLFDRSCRYIKSGVLELNRDDKEVIIDFGDGECDLWATVTIDGESKLVDLSKRGKKIQGFRGKGK